MKTLTPFVATFIGPLVVTALTSVAAHAQTQTASHPCEAVKKACEAAGFVQGDAKQGFGLWKDCIDPMIQGKPQPKTATKALPSVDPSVVAACKAKRPSWGEGKQK